VKFATAVLAVHGIEIVPRQATLWTLVTHFGRPEYRLYQPDEKRNAYDHDHDRQQSALAADQDDIAEARRRQRCNCEIQRIDVVINLRIRFLLQNENERSHNEDEHHQVKRAEHNLFVAPKKSEVLLQLFRYIIRTQYSHRANDSQECETSGDLRKEQRHDDRNIEQRERARYKAPSVILCDEAAGQLDNKNSANDSIGDKNPLFERQESRRDKIENDRRIDGEHNDPSTHTERTGPVEKFPAKFSDRRHKAISAWNADNLTANSTLSSGSCGNS
jgi:hypothetical protein